MSRVSKPRERVMWSLEPRKAPTVGVGVVVATVRVGVVVRVLVAGRGTVVAAAVVVTLRADWSAIILEWRCCINGVEVLADKSHSCHGDQELVIQRHDIPGSCYRYQ
jgi:hypothetical protein